LRVCARSGRWDSSWGSWQHQRAAESYIDRFIDDLGALGDGHEGSVFEVLAYGLFYVAAFPANMAANGRASKTVRISAIFSPLTLYHSQTNAVPAGLGPHVVQDAYIVAIGENLFHIDSLNDGMQFFQGLEIWLGAMKSVDGALEQ
jgi:hypothetical protein